MGVHPKTIARAVRQGRLAVVRPTRKAVRILASEAERFIGEITSLPPRQTVVLSLKDAESHKLVADAQRFDVMPKPGDAIDVGGVRYEATGDIYAGDDVVASGTLMVKRQGAS